MGTLKSYLPVMGMVFNQFIYTGLSLSTRLVFSEGMNPRVFVVYRHLLATIVIAPIAYLSGRNSGSYYLNLKSFSWIFLVSFVGITLNQNLFCEGLYLTNSSVATAMVNLVPAVTFVIAVCAGMEKVSIGSLRSIAKIVGTVICVSGAVSIALLKGPKLLNAENLPSKSIIMASSATDNWFLGCLFLIGCCFSWSTWLILMVPASKSHPDPLSFSAWMCFIATVQSALVTLLLEPDPNTWKINSLLEVGSALYGGVMGSAVSFFLQAWCISITGPLFSAMFNPLMAVFVTILAPFLLQEEVYVGSLTGSIAVIIGLYIVLWGKAEEVVNVKRDSESMLNSTEEVKISINKDSSSVKECCKTNLEEPLLSPHSPSHN
ncbi:WAT1-related protein At4g30420-like [Vigna unguiculata]|uniref:WAT1-related protein n=1 Tax=Vigna unguiculata TaxID=3917 RepID=A0A4D6MXU9_VIGUN|nr:WAT1-related protein At4g30420-like [Vigna unguiculata]QCE04707.1 WAT1-related protein [Vigna unguiculata]